MKIFVNGFIIFILLVVINLQSLYCKEQNMINSLDAPINSTKEYKLKNGLKIIIREDSSAPLFSQTIFYKIGAINDKESFTGAAHFLEHMQFNGTQTRPKGMIAEEMEKRGATFNAATSNDYTMYYLTLPSGKDNLEFAMGLEADRMRNSIINEEEIQREKQVILSELSGGENNPITILYRETLKEIFPNHPYGDPIIGWRKDVSSIKAIDLKEHYDDYYQPDNAVLVIAGDIKTQEVLEEAEKTFGNIPSTSINRKIRASRHNIETSNHGIEIFAPSESKAVLFAWQCPSFINKDYIALSMLSSILTKGNLSRLEKKIVDTGKAANINSSVRQGIDPFVFSILATTSKEGDLDEITKITLKEIKTIRENGISNEELERVKAKAETSFLFGLEDPSEITLQLGFFELISGDWKRTFSWVDELKSINQEDIKRVANLYLTDDKLFLSKLINSNSNEIKINKTQKPFEENLFKAKQKGIQAKEITFKNGLKLILRENENVPVISIHGTIDAGEIYENKKQNYAVATLTAMMLDRGTENLNRNNISSILENMGASIEFSADTEVINLEAQSRSSDKEKLISLIAQELRKPLFAEEEFVKLKTQLLLQLEQSRDDLDYLGKIAFNQLLYSENHPYYELSINEQIEKLKALSIKDLKEFYKAYYEPKRIILVISGDFANDEMTNLIAEYFGDWTNTNTAKDFNIPNVEIKKTQETKIIEVAGKSQANIIIGHAGVINRKDKDFYALLVANDILGGGSTLTSKLGKEIREKKGLVYSVYSRFNAYRGAGSFKINLGTNPKNIDEAITSAKEIIKAFLLGDISDEEITRAKNYRKGAFIAHNLVSNANVASALNLYAILGLDLNTINDYPKIIDSLTKEEIISAAKKYIYPDNLQIVIIKPKN